MFIPIPLRSSLLPAIHLPHPTTRLDHIAEVLKQEDVTVTNMSDKEVQLPKLLKLSDEVLNCMKRINDFNVRLDVEC